MIRSLFIANRGEIAMRIVRACKELGITSVIGYSQADKDTLPVKFADKKVCLGPAAADQSYLNIGNLVAAASGSGCDAVHPGVGFLSESAEFAEKVESEGLIFVGPRPKAIALLGDKVLAKKVAIKSSVPVVPGTDGAVENISDVKSFVKEHGYPIIIKAASGGGGKGMRVVEKDEDLEHSLSITASEAEKAFSDKRVYVEKFLQNPRHIEFQLIADNHGNVVHLGERDCTVQMKHQKLIEESPSPSLDEKMRESMGKASVSLLKNAEYSNAGTVEYLVDGDTFYFMEVNSRIQVEHPVTELVSGIDLIEWQIRVASNEKLSFKQKDITSDGYAMECRINALAPGRIEHMLLPGGIGVRIDSWIGQDSTVSPFYDSLLVKLLVHAEDREKGIKKMQRALFELELSGRGFSHNKEWFQKILDNSLFKSGNYNIHFLEETKILEK